MAVLHARGELGVGDRFRGVSIIDSVFDCRIEGETTLAERPAILPSVSGRAWLTGTTQLHLDPARSVAGRLSAKRHLASRRGGSCLRSRRRREREPQLERVRL